MKCPKRHTIWDGGSILSLPTELSLGEPIKAELITSVQI